ncbi:MAG TPA: hypothetical protein VLC91_01420, partial [Spongiibacteraceae bacterium]|nr:hypothetical protein [Spongiibacteraceae bacterium]
MLFDIAAVPFSRYGSYLAFAHLPAQANRPAGIYLRTLHGAAPQREILRCELSDAAGPVATAAIAVRTTPSCLEMRTATGRIEICFSDTCSVRMRGEGLGLRLVFAPQLYDLALPRGPHWQLNLFSSRMNLALTALAGSIHVDAPCTEDGAEHLLVQCLPDASGHFEIDLCEFQSTWPPAEKLPVVDFRGCERAAAAEFNQWLQQTPAVPAQYAQARELAAYVQWSCAVEACGQLQRPALLMSKNWLHAVWSWDHCFNAMALLAGNPALAWDQFMLPFDRQDRHGALPDCFDDERTVWNFCKPPIHGWALMWMLRRTTFIGRKQLQEIYAPLSRWTAWWSEQRDDSGDGLPQ